MARGGPAAASAALVALTLLPGCSLLLDFSAPVGDGAPADADSTDASDTCAKDEPNDDLTTATPAVSGTINASLCDPGDRDFYGFTVDGASDVVVELSFRGEDGTRDLELTLYRGAKALTISTGLNDDERIEHSMALANVLPAGDYLLEVFGRDPEVTNDYVLVLTIGTVDAGVPP
jgi:hypothetical protein